jgi:hypothetical protein
MVSRIPKKVMNSGREIGLKAIAAEFSLGSF